MRKFYTIYAITIRKIYMYVLKSPLILSHVFGNSDFRVCEGFFSQSLARKIKGRKFGDRNGAGAGTRTGWYGNR